MAKVYNWQLGREMTYWYPEVRPQKQFGGIFDVNKCIACQTCTLACKTTWTSGKGQEYMLWNSVETKPYGYYPLGWDVKLLDMLGAQSFGADGKYAGKTIFESAPAGERVQGWRPTQRDYAYPNLGEDDCAGAVDKGAHMTLPHMNWFFYLARTCCHCTYPGCLASCPRGSIYKRPEDGIVLVDQSRCRGYQECVRGCPYKRTFFNPMTGTTEKCVGCIPKHEAGLSPQCFTNCIGKIRLAGHISKPDKMREDNPMDFLVHVKKVALPLFPQFGTEPNMFYVPPIHAPAEFLRQIFGPGVEEAQKAYFNAHKDMDLAGLLTLFGSTEQIIDRFKREKETMIGWNEKGEEIIRVPITEPTYIREALASARGVLSTNVP